MQRSEPETREIDRDGLAQSLCDDILSAESKPIGAILVLIDEEHHVMVSLTGDNDAMKPMVIALMDALSDHARREIAANPELQENCAECDKRSCPAHPSNTETVASFNGVCIHPGNDTKN